MTRLAVPGRHLSPRGRTRRQTSARLRYPRRSPGGVRKLLPRQRPPFGRGSTAFLIDPVESPCGTMSPCLGLSRTRLRPHARTAQRYGSTGALPCVVPGSEFFGDKTAIADAVAGPKKNGPPTTPGSAARGRRMSANVSLAGSRAGIWPRSVCNRSQDQLHSSRATQARQAKRVATLDGVILWASNRSNDCELGCHQKLTQPS